MDGFSLVPLKNANSVEEELSLLEQLKAVLSPLRSEISITESDDDFEIKWLQRGGTEIENPFPSKTPEEQFSSQSDLAQFTFYLFERRFGWSEYASNTNFEEDEHEFVNNNIRRESSVPSLRVLDETRFKGKINELLDEFLKWYIAQSVLSVRLLESLKYAISQASAMPVVRSQIFVHVMEWLKYTTDCGIQKAVFTFAKDLIVLGLTDVWSAVRNTCVARLSPILHHLDIIQMEVLFTSLIKICQAKESSWQAKEGAVMGMTAAVREFQWIGLSTNEKDAEGLDNKRYVLKYGKTKLESLPGYITGSVHSVLYAVLAHPQLSIREHATKAFSSILSRCEFQEALSSFQEVIKRLCHGTQPGDLEDGKLPHTAVVRQDFKFLKAYEAEGLLGVCVFLIKHIPPSFLLPNWPLYFSTFNLYLMHPASTVRQATSAVFKYLVAKDSSNPVLLKLVLQGLAAEWNIDNELINSTLSVSSRTLNHGAAEECCNMLRQLQTEGRTSFEEFQTTNSVKKNIFPPSPTPPPSPSPSPISIPRWLPVDSVSGMERLSPTPTSASASFTDQIGNLCLGHSGSWPSHKPRRIGIRQITKLSAESEISAECLVSEAWEWREGRLFAYELILKFLITNHIHYLFPSFALPTSHARAAVSVDENLIGRQASPSGPHLRERSKSEFSTSSYVLKSHSTSTLPPIRTSPLHTSTSIKEGKSGFSALEEKSNGTDRDPEHRSRQNSETFSRKTTRSTSIDFKEQVPDNQKLFRRISLSSQVYPSRPFRPPKAHSLSLVNSLLSQTKVFDAEENSNTEKWSCCSSHIGTPLKSPIGDILFQNVGEVANETKHLDRLSSTFSLTNGDGGLPGWTKKVKLESTSTILSQVLLQAIECLADSRWELRRMAQQVLPLATETVRWFDISILEELWNKCLTPERTLLCYGACLALKNSIIHASRLVQFLESPPVTWKDPESCSRVAQAIVSAVQRGLPKWMQQIHSILCYPSCDKLSVVAMETIMSSHISSTLNPVSCEKKMKEEETLLVQILIIFINSFPENALASTLRNLPRFEDVQPLMSTLEGFLSCSSKVTSPEKHAQQVGKYVISELHGLLPRFLKTCRVKELVIVFPVWIHYVGDFSEDSTVCKSLVDGLYSTLISIKTLLPREDQSRCNELQTAMETYFNYGILEISNLLMSKVLDLCLVRQLLDLFSRVCEVIKRPTFLGFIFKAISSRLDFEPDLVRLMSISGGSSRANTPDLCMLSNDIPTSPVDEPAFPTEEEDEPENGRVMHESLALDACQESAKMASRVTSPDANDESDVSSDWDSWEDENEDQTALTAVFADFLRHISDMYKERSQGVSIFEEELNKCGSLEKKVVRNIMESRET